MTEQPKQSVLTLIQMQQGIERLSRRLEAVQSFDPQSIEQQFDSPELDALMASITDALERTFGANTTDSQRYAEAAVFRWGPSSYIHSTPIHEIRAALERSKRSKWSISRVPRSQGSQP